MPKKRRDDVASPSTELSPNQIESFVRHLVSKTPRVRMKAAFALMRAGRPALARAIELSGDPRPLMREMACVVLGRAGTGDFLLPGQNNALPVYYREGVPVLLRLLAEDPVNSVRSTAAGALGFQSLPETLTALCVNATDPSPEVRLGVAIGLAEFDGTVLEVAANAGYREEVINTLVRLMNDGDAEVRNWATFGVHAGGYNTQETRDQLWTAMDDPNPNVRGEAADGLASFGVREFVPRLAKMLLDDDVMIPMYFSAAERLGDPALLTTVQKAAARWRSSAHSGEEAHPYISSALKALSEAGAAMVDVAP